MSEKSNNWKLDLIISGDCTLNQLFDACRVGKEFPEAPVKIFSIKEDCTGNAGVTFEGLGIDLAIMRKVYCTEMHTPSHADIIQEEIQNYPIYFNEEVPSA